MQENSKQLYFITEVLQVYAAFHHVQEMFLIRVKHRQETICLSSTVRLAYTTMRARTHTH